jgi:hypothetical protein
VYSKESAIPQTLSPIMKLYLNPIHISPVQSPEEIGSVPA